MNNVKYFLVTYDRLRDRVVDQLDQEERSKLYCYQVQKSVKKNITSLINTLPVKEWELPWNSFSFQTKQYYEYCCMIHLYKNSYILKDVTHVGVFHYDVTFARNSVHRVNTVLDLAPETIFYQKKRERNQMSLLDYEYRMLCDFMSNMLDIFIDPDYIELNGWVSECLSVTPVDVFLKFGEFLLTSAPTIEHILKNNIWGIMNHCPHRICGIVERMWGFYLTSLKRPMMQIDVTHDWDLYSHHHMSMNGTGAQTL